MKVRFIILLFLIFNIFFIAGCSNIEQLDDKMIIHGVGIDRVENTFELTIQQFSVTGSNEKEEGAQVVKTKGNSLMDAFSDLSLQTGKTPMFSQNLVLAIGEETAYNGINDILDFFVRYYESRPTVKIIIVKGKAESVLSFKKDDKLIMAKDIMAITESERINSKVMSSNIFQFVGALKNSTLDPIASIVSVEMQNDEEILAANGTAVFKNDKLAGFIDTNSTRGALIINNRLNGGTEVIDVESVGKVSYSLEKSKSKVKFKLENGKPIYNIIIKINTNIYEIERDIKTQLPDNAFNLMEEALISRIKTITNQAIYKSIFEYNSDIFGFGQIALKSDKEYFRTVENNWDQAMKEAKYNIDVSVKIDDTGQGIGYS